ncbi:hypothetical protein VA7868_02180 [Vibrio aerogenes CECT 7868]|uniref:YitT family protein n=1 Tax=Vibrio aerogenes CECT 7868 TaxID=1216006 RepID=A0A1M5Z1G5_9VIBR|nr:YitT family protein [Vibrio aerogenes]SHI18086.1 hypothetical protein VA7868_02180 [Vibrio aerogenes CECT 7868]
MEKHSYKEDIIAMITGCFLVALGINFLQSAQMITGGTAGLALLLDQFMPLSFGTLYFLCNTPFYLLAWKKFGLRFAGNSILCGLAVSVLSDHIAMFMKLNSLNDVYCAVVGGLLMGIGMLVLFRHHSSLGGFNVFCLYVQDNFGIAAGKVQLCIDAVIVMTSLFYLSAYVVGVSVLSAVVLNIVLAMNHKPSRYIVTYH